MANSEITPNTIKLHLTEHFSVLNSAIFIKIQCNSLPMVMSNIILGDAKKRTNLIMSKTKKLDLFPHQATDEHLDRVSFCIALIWQMQFGKSYHQDKAINYHTISAAVVVKTLSEYESHFGKKMSGLYRVRSAIRLITLFRICWVKNMQCAGSNSLNLNWINKIVEAWQMEKSGKYPE